MERAATARAWGPGMRLLHWATAALVVLAWTLGEAAEDGGMGLEAHAGAGLAVLALTALRLLARAVVRAPQGEEAGWMRSAARAVHLALYALLLAVPLLGAASLWADGAAVRAAGLLVLPSPWTPAPRLAHGLGEVHGALAGGLLALALLHAAAALFHHLVLRDGTLARMPLLRPRRGRVG